MQEPGLVLFQHSMIPREALKQTQIHILLSQSLPRSALSSPQNLMCSHVGRGFLLVLVLLFLLVFVFLFFLGVKVLTAYVE